MNLKSLLVSFIFVLLSFLIFSQTEEKTENTLPNYVGYINDFETLFSSEQLAELNEISINHEKEAKNELVVVSTVSFEPYYSPFAYSLALANYWGIGKKEKDNGVLIVFGKQMRQIWIQVGTGLETKLTDEETKSIIDLVMIPEFKKGDYFIGVKKGMLAIVEEIK